MSGTAVRRTQTERRRESEGRLIRGAIEIIARHGVEALTFEALGRESGLSRGLVTQRFGSKQKLLEAILVALHDNQEARLADAGLEALPGMAAVLGYVDMGLHQMSRSADTRAYFLLLSSSLNEPGGLRTIFRATHAEVEARLQGWIRKGQADRTIGQAIGARSMALIVGCLMFGMAMQLLIDPEMDIEPVRRDAIDALRTSLSR